MVGLRVGCLETKEVALEIVAGDGIGSKFSAGLGCKPEAKEGPKAGLREGARASPGAGVWAGLREGLIVVGRFMRPGSAEAVFSVVDCGVTNGL